MESRNHSQKSEVPTVTIQVSGKLFQGHLSYLQQLVESAIDCGLWPVLGLARLQEIDHLAAAYLTKGEGSDFAIVSCPEFVRNCMNDEQGRAA